MNPDYRRVIYFKITEMNYPLALELIDAPRFSAIPVKEVVGNYLAFETSTFMEGTVLRTHTSTSWMSKKMFKKVFGKEMKRYSYRFTHLK